MGPVGAGQHGVAGVGIGVPLVQRLDIDRRQLPALERIVAPVVEALELHFPADGQPEFEQMNAVARDALLEFGRFVEEMLGLLGRAEAHDLFHPGAVVPGAVEQYGLPGGGEPVDITLEIPLRAFPVIGLGQGRDEIVARIEIFQIRLDGAALAGGVAPLEDDHDAVARAGQMGLQQHQLLLQAIHLLFIETPIQLIFIGIAARGHGVLADRLGQVGIFEVEAVEGIAHRCLSIVMITVQ